MSNEGFFQPVPGVQPTPSGAYLWRYVPNMGAAILFLLLFTGSFSYISFKIWKTRAHFCIALAVGCLLELVGYGVRAGAHDQTGDKMPYILQAVFILVAPVLFAATIYMMLGRIILSVQGERLSPIKPSKITLIFVLGDLTAFIVQCGGSGMSVIQNADIAKWADRITIIGLAIQIVMFGIFCFLSSVFHMRMRKVRAIPESAPSTSMSWETSLHMLYAVSSLIMVRSIFRVVEFAQGQTGYSLSHEWTLYVFDSLLMFAVTVLFAWRFPAEVGRKEMEVNGGMEM